MKGVNRSIAGKLYAALYRQGWRRSAFAIMLLVAGVVYWFSLPEPVIDRPYSTVLEASDGELLNASIAADGQWRFPAGDRVPGKFAEALVAFEDKRFYYHPGVDPLAFLRALLQNLRAGKVVSGGSTISMQVIRLSRPGQPRNVWQKVIEMILATRLELRYSKDEILSLYAAHAPFGGNVVGLEAACWRYFGRSPETLSWAEGAMLAVLPNAPSLIHPGRNRSELREKRDRLLDRLLAAGAIDSLTCALSKAEPIPGAPQPLPGKARHLLARLKKDGNAGKRVVSTLNGDLQERVEEKLQRHHDRLKGNQVFNGAVLVLDVNSGRVLAYAGNVAEADGRHGEEVDVITAARSTGSILKPLLFAAALDDGLILPNTLLPDIPVFLNGFAPQNFSRQYDGAVPASAALIRSLNVPSVFLLQRYRYEKLHTLLGNAGLTTLVFPPDHYGLSLILGGAEGTLWDITGVYASMARTLNNYFQRPGGHRYQRTDFHPPAYVGGDIAEPPHDIEATSWLSASSIFLTFEALRELHRPDEESGWKHFSSAAPIAWKTGTSFGFRDAWAVGVTPLYAVGVWVGNADGEGRPGLTGIQSAAPLMFDIFSDLRGDGWFQQPASELVPVITCRQSGQRLSTHCPEADTLLAPKAGLNTQACTYHKTIHLSPAGDYRVHSACAAIAGMRHEKWFVLPPVQEHYYQAHNVSYKTLPPFRMDCFDPSSLVTMDLIYPEANARILIPRGFEGQVGSSVFELAHRDAAAAVYWHLDGRFVGETRGIHRLALSPAEGPHTLTVVDEYGRSLEEHFTVISSL